MAGITTLELSTILSQGTYIIPRFTMGDWLGDGEEQSCPTAAILVPWDRMVLTSKIALLDDPEAVLSHNVVRNYVGPLGQGGKPYVLLLTVPEAVLSLKEN